MKLKGAEIVVRTLMEQGVDLIYGYPGATVIDVFDALYDQADRVHFVLTADEQGATHAANGYARATGRPGVVIATSGPGATNLVTGIATAHLDSVPLVVVTGNVPQANIATDAFQEVDICGITLPITKHNYFVSDPAQIAPTIREAFSIAISGRPGPVLVDITKDAQEALVEYLEQPAVRAVPQEVLATPEELLEAATAINEARRPYVYVGGGVINAGASDAVVRLADMIDAPIGCSLMGVSAIPDSNPRFLGMEGMHGHVASTMAMRECDVLIALGVRFNDRATGERSHFKQGATIVHIDADASELSKNTQDTHMLVGDLRLTLERLEPLIERRARTSWSEYVAGMRIREEQSLDRRGGLTPRNAMLALAAAIDDDTVVVTDVGQHQMWAAQFLGFSRPRSFITNGGLGTMGFGLGAAIGAAMGTGRRVVLIVGDGGFGMSLAELATAVTEGVPLTVLIMNNHVLGMVRQWQSLFYGRRFAATSLEHRQTDYVALARAFGARSERADTLEELKAWLAEAQDAPGTFLIDCAIGEDELVLPMMAPGGSLADVIDRVGD